MSTKEQMQSARLLIRAGQYDDARRILKRINHPKAREWLARLDEVAPVSKVFYQKRPFKVLVVFIVLAIVAGVTLFAWGTQTRREAVLSVWTWSYCIDVRIEFDRDTDICTDWADQVIVQRSEIVNYCYDLSESQVNRDLYEDCLADRNVFPPLSR